MKLAVTARFVRRDARHRAGGNFLSLLRLGQAASELQRIASMATEIRVPKIAASATKASIGRWFKQVGDPVSLDEPLVEIETDGATVEVTASATGVLSDILFVGRRRRKGRYVAGNDYRVGRQYEDRWCALNVSDFPHTRTIETAVSAHVIKAFSRIRSQKWATSTNIQSRLSTRLNFPVSGTPMTVGCE